MFKVEKKKISSICNSLGFISSIEPGIKLSVVFSIIIICFPHTPSESKFVLPLVFTKMLLSAKCMRKNSILTSGGNKECRKSQAYCPRLRLGHQFTCDLEHFLFFLPQLVIYYSLSYTLKSKDILIILTVREIFGILYFTLYTEKNHRKRKFTYLRLNAESARKFEKHWKTMLPQFTRIDSK